MTTKVYLRKDGVLHTAEFTGKLNHQFVQQVFKQQEFKPDDNRFLITYQEEK